MMMTSTHHPHRPSARWGLAWMLLFLAWNLLSQQHGITSADAMVVGVGGKVAVAGATGRTGRYIVQELLERNIPVVALVRDERKAKEIFFNEDDSLLLTTKNLDHNKKLLLEIVPCDLSQLDQVESALRGCNAAIWAASGITGPVPPPKQSFGGILEKMIQKVFNNNNNHGKTDTTSSSSSSSIIDLVAIPNICQCLAKNNNNNPISSNKKDATTLPPQLVMLSSAGVTRLGWDDQLKQQLSGCADIPIVRLNPGNILNIKAETEDLVRKSGIRYSIVRPCGLNDKWPVRSRPVLSQGDVAVGRIHRKDVASVVVQSLLSSQATGKTFEVLALAGYPPPSPNAMETTLSRLNKDDTDAKSSSVEHIIRNYHILQQLLPGEKQDAAALAMGQTYEQLDRNQVGRLGKRGQEDFSRL